MSFPDDPPEYNKLYLVPGLGFLAGYLACTQGNYPDVHQAAYLAASLCCVGALTGLSSQTTSRIGEPKNFPSLKWITELESKTQ